MSEDLSYFVELGVPDNVINFHTQEREAKLAAQSALVQKDLGLFVDHVWKQRLAAIGLGAALGTVGGIINLITEPALTTGLIAFGTFPAAILGISRLLFKNRVRVNDHIYDWSGNWNDRRRAQERAAEIAASSWEFNGETMWIDSEGTDNNGRRYWTIGTPRGKITTHDIQSVRPRRP